MKKEAISSLVARRLFLRRLGGAAVAAGAAGVVREAAAKSESASGPASFPTPDYDWTKRRWAFGVDATKCIGCLRCVEACKVENDVPLTAHHFRTWVERYVYLEGETGPRIDSHADPVNIAASGSEREYRFADRYKDAKVEKAFFVPKLCNQCGHPPCVQVCPVGARVFGDRNDKQSPISLFIRNNRVHVLRPETGNAPNVFYVGLDKEVS